MTTTTTTPPSDVTADEFAERLFGAALGTMEILSVHLGDRLGWYRALAEGGPASPEELVARAGGNLRYAREWLEQQAVYGILEAADSGEGGADERRFTLPPGAREVLTDTSSLGYLGPLARMLVGSAVQMPALLAAYRHGGGVSWAQLGEDARESQADMNRPWFERQLAGALQGVDTVDAVLRRPGARIADIGCGAGWSSIALSRAYPQASVDGHDVDAPSVSLANTNAAAAGVLASAASSPPSPVENVTKRGHLLAGDYDILVLDILLPAMDGFDVCRALRRADIWTPVLVLTALGDVEDRITGLDAGDDRLAACSTDQRAVGRHDLLGIPPAHGLGRDGRLPRVPREPARHH